MDKLQKNPGKLEIIGTGQQARDFVHVRDIAEALTLTAEEKAIGKTYNLGFGETTKIIDLAKMMLKILNLTDKTFVTMTNQSWQGDIDTIWFDIAKAKTELGWTPNIRIEDHLRTLIAERKMI
jgi:UDP-glucose 4-epimerase